ncbi:MAG: ferritin-like domain-containing protein [Acidithiobacillus sp.]|uniref:ferritin-like domain-containing protein n=1 Tax=Acidithiobacillus sp. TaxID=1872118 RepID=UPI0035609691
MNETENNALDRRDFFRKSVLFGLGLAAVSTLSMPALAGAATLPKDPKHDLYLLNFALNAEHQAIAAYQVVAESKLLDPALLKVALSFQADHKAHAAIHAKTIKKLGGTPVAPKVPLSSPMPELAKTWGFPLDKLKTQNDVLHFAAGLEVGAAKGYLGTVPQFSNPELAHAAANIEGDEAMHFAVLRSALGEFPVPAAFISAMPS